MELNEKQLNLLKMLPGIDHIIELSKTEPSFFNVPRSVLLLSIRKTVGKLRNEILDVSHGLNEKDLTDSMVIEKIKDVVNKAMTPNLKQVINATGVVIHTNLGRSILAADALANLDLIAGNYSNLEFDLEKGERGLRYTAVEELLCELSGAEAAMAVNNNAAAVLLCLETIARNKSVIVSRGELVEIGGSFRIPDIIAKSGAILKEVGTTNRTRFQDYAGAIENETGLLLKVHTSNYSIVGFTENVNLKELVSLGSKHNIPVMEDLGSGTFIDFSAYGLTKEPTVQDSVSAGADIVTFSGDKLLGGPQAGIIVGKKDILDKIKKNPLTRALRIDKLTLAALESTLRLYRDPEKAVQLIPTLLMLTIPVDLIKKRAAKLIRLLTGIKNSALSVKPVDLNSKAGGGSLPLIDLPSKCIAMKIAGMSANFIERSMRENIPPIIGRIEDDNYIMDIRTVKEDELIIIKDAVTAILRRN
ncbi:L-seryl-tRNA(Sec) selenium transferase [Desulfobacterium sp. N47]|uniref:L-seryl-tRNA(Sec) selenium transferase n=1 Tax=uncultured Desulfobacterium sp. TaxID=201089 RepID=E1YKR2_9BACT|nr:L-seryl-tRNA(Sec) selenium transferase [uncultured Desulfobacterium sp.]